MVGSVSMRVSPVKANLCATKVPPLHHERTYVLNLLTEVDSLLELFVKQHNPHPHEFSEYKNIPAKYWHRLYQAYIVFMQVPGNVLHIYSRSERKQMYMYIRLLPTLIPFDKVLKHRKFNIFRRVSYDLVRNRLVKRVYSWFQGK